MAYIGNGPEVNFFTNKLEKFSGTGACTQFTLTRTIDDANAITVVVNSVLQTPIASYSVSSGVVTFTEAPSLGTENILVNYDSPVMVTFNQVSSSQILANSVGTTQLAPNSVTTDKIAPGTIIETDVADGSITTSKIAVEAITGNLVANNAISGNNIVSPPDIFDDAFLFGGM
jgi:hypothetical protein